MPLIVKELTSNQPTPIFLIKRFNKNLDKDHIIATVLRIQCSH